MPGSQMTPPPDACGCSDQGCSKSKEYVSAEEAEVLAAMRKVRLQARDLQDSLHRIGPDESRHRPLSRELERLRARFRVLKSKLALANEEKLRRLGHLVVTPLLMATLAACSGPAQQSSEPTGPNRQAPKAAAKPKPAPASAQPAPANTPGALTPSTARCVISAGMGLPRGAKQTAQRQLKSSGPVQGRKVIFSRGGAKLVFPASALDHLRRFLKDHGPSNFPDERSLLSQLERAAAGNTDITIGPSFPWHSGSAVIMKRRISFLLADLLAAGSFEIRLPGQDGPVLEVTELEYSSYCGELCGAGGRAYLLPGCTALFYTVDWVS